MIDRMPFKNIKANEDDEKHNKYRIRILRETDKGTQEICRELKKYQVDAICDQLNLEDDDWSDIKVCREDKQLEQSNTCKESTSKPIKHPDFASVHFTKCTECKIKRVSAYFDMVMYAATAKISKLPEAEEHMKEIKRILAEEHMKEIKRILAELEITEEKFQSDVSALIDRINYYY